MSRRLASVAARPVAPPQAIDDNPDLPAGRLYKVAEVAKILGCSERQVYRLIDAHELRVTSIGMAGGTRKIRADVLQAFIDERTH